MRRIGGPALAALLLLALAAASGAGLLAGPAGPVPDERILVEIRLPRLLLGLAVGASLGLAGGIAQGIFANPLAEPFLLGISSGAALGAAVGLLAGLPAATLVPAAAALGGGGALCVAIAAARTGGSLPRDRLLLAGVMTNALCGAALTLLVSLYPERLHGVLFWMIGTLALADSLAAAVVAVPLAAGLLLLPFAARALDALAQGDEEARSLGVRPERARLALFLLAAALGGVPVAFAGMIGFVGLVAPHLARLAAGPVHRRMLLPAAALGAAGLVLADAASRAVLPPREIPVGVVTALAGAPFFLHLLRRTR